MLIVHEVGRELCSHQVDRAFIEGWYLNKDLKLLRERALRISEEKAKQR